MCIFISRMGNAHASIPRWPNRRGCGVLRGDNVPDDGYAVLVVDAIAVEREARSRPPGSDCEA